MSDPVFVAGAGSSAAVKKRKKKMVQVEEEEGNTQQQQQNAEPLTAPSTGVGATSSSTVDEFDATVRADEEDANAPNPLADAMASSAEQVAKEAEAQQQKEETATRTNGGAKKKSNLAYSVNSSSTASSELNDAAASLSSFAATGSRSNQSSSSSSSTFASSSSSSSQSQRKAPRDDFDDALDQALGGGGRRSAATATSAGYIDPNDINTIQRAQKARGQPVQDEFEFEEVADVSNQSLATAGGKSSQFDEFDDVWNSTQPAAGGRKVLKASKTQQAVEKPNAKEDARMKLEAALREAEQRAAEEQAERERQEAEGMQNPILAKLGIAPTNILAQYEDDAKSKSITQKQEPTKKPKREQDQLESTDAQLLAPVESVPVVNTVDALVAAHTRSYDPVASASSSASSPAADSNVDQWGAVNELREKQEAAARADAARALAAGKQIGVKQADNITRDTPIHYDSALKSLTVAPSCPPPKRYADDGSELPSIPSVAVQLQKLKEGMMITDFRDLSFGRKMRYSMFPPKLKSLKLEEERDLCFCMARMKIDYDNCVDHERILCSLYRGLTGDQLAPPTFGNHWQLIGFQANDPSTDLRGGGLFSLIQLLWFMKHHKELMLKIYQLSLDERQNFPFATLSTNLSGMVLQALRECVIYGECRRQNSVFTVVHTLYVAAFYEMYLKWKNDNCTIVSWSDVKQHVEHLVLHAPKPLMAKFKANQYAMSGEDQTALEFTEIP